MFKTLPDGYIIMSINLDPKVFKDAATNVVKKSCQWEVIFKSTKPGDMDDHRHQTTVDDRTFRGKDIKAIQNKILELGHVIFASYQWMERKLIRSVAGGSVQEQHTDFVKKDMEGLEDGQFPVSVLAPLNQAAKLHIGDKVVTIHVGQVLFFSPNLVHGGASYDHNNIRFFGKLGFISEKDYVENHLDVDVGKAFMCGFCGKSHVNKETHRSHTKFCAKNPVGEDNRKKRSLSRKDTKKGRETSSAAKHAKTDSESKNDSDKTDSG